MESRLFSANWYRIADIKPRLRGHAQLQRQIYRGQNWFVLQDPASGRFHRFSPAAHFIIGLMNGERTVVEIWELAAERLGDDLPGQDDVIRLFHQLYAADLLHADVPPDIAELSGRSRTAARRSSWVRSIRSPLAVRIPLIDPDRFLNATAPLFTPLFSLPGFLLWLAVVVYGGILGATHFDALTSNLADRVLAADNMILLLVLFPMIKALHELGHGYSAKRWKGEVHEMGVMFLVLMPVPYVDASGAAGFRHKRQRAVVGAAGMMVEVLLAAVAMIVWVVAEPGTLVRAAAFNTIFIAGVSTLVFNGNPLLKFDGYYIFSDLIEIPNLGTRANRYVGYVVQRYLFGVKTLTSPVTARGERGWLFWYAVLAFGYRLTIMASIAFFVATKFFTVGILLAVWGIVMMLGLPVYKGLKHLAFGASLKGKRARALAVIGVGLAAIAGAIVSVPLPSATLAEGVVWVPENTMVHSGAEGVVSAVVAEPDSFVRAGDPLVAMEDPILDARVRILEAELREYEARHAALQVSDLVQAGIAEDQIDHIRAQLALALDRAAALTLTSPVDGYFLLPDAGNLPGRYVTKGEVVAYVTEFAEFTVRVAVPQDSIDLVRWQTERIDVRLAEYPASVFTASVARDVPGGTDRLPSLALSRVGGGPFSLDPRDPESQKTLERLFQMELTLPSDAAVSRLGGRVFVRFHHGEEPLATQIYRAVRQVFLRQFDV